jgi:small subunit ribosomal protein S14
MNTFFIKKKISPTPYKVFKPVFDHSSSSTSLLSSKLFIKFSRSRNMHSKTEKILNIFKFIRLSPSFSNFHRSFTNLQVDKSLKNFASTKYKSTSLLNGRALSFSNDFKLSRIPLRKLASLGYLPGVSKASW